jgi:hypothetical protein
VRGVQTDGTTVIDEQEIDTAQQRPRSLNHAGLLRFLLQCRLPVRVVQIPDKDSQ